MGCACLKHRRALEKEDERCSSVLSSSHSNRESRGLQLTSATSLYNEQCKHKDSIVKDRESRNEEFLNIHELESAIHLSRKEQ